jgi:hypothetical protein
VPAQSAHVAVLPVERDPQSAAATSGLAAYQATLEHALLGSVLLPFVIVIASRYNRGLPFDAGYVGGEAVTLAAALAGFALVRRTLRRHQRPIAAAAAEQSAAIDRVSARWIRPAIATAAALSLLLELATIRWQASVFEFYALYKNLALLSCFVGLGIGYATAARKAIPLFAVGPLFAWQFLLLTAIRYGLDHGELESLLVNPFRENLNMGSRNAMTAAHFLAVYGAILVVFVLTALTFVPIGQLCGRLMERCEKLSAYGMNLLGSFVGVLAMLGLSWEWAPPAAWFGLCFGLLFLYQAFDARLLLASACAALVGATVLAWPVAIGWERVFSPYQLVERGFGLIGAQTIRAAGHYYQTIFDFSPSARARDEKLDRVERYYDLPYRVHTPPGEVAVVGAGTGNDVAAALRSGATAVDAVEIDPAILRFGELYHPERPYQSSRVRGILNDARSFLRGTTRSYDLIVYGLLDSHAILSQASSVRLDSFVYTVEALREARAHPKPGGMMSLSFLVTPELGRKIYLMMTEAFDGHPPVCVDVRFYGITTFLQNREGQLAPPTALLEAGGFQDVGARYADARLAADASTDDWPFFYMPKRVFPRSYVALLVVLLGASWVLVARFLEPKERTRQPAFFLLGAGFMLVETKAITELGLTFGNTWHVIGAVICGVLLMAFLANWVARASSIEGRVWPYLLIAVSLAAGFAIARAGGLPWTFWGRLGTLALLTSPLFFSGLAFSSLLRRSTNVSAAMGQNVLGAMFGGVLEYNSMYLGFSALYLIAIALYLGALVVSPHTRVGEA